MENIEIKVRIPELVCIRDRLAELGADDHGEIEQVDTYFIVNHGRLKLRFERHQDDIQTGSLISYLRPDDTTSRISHYRVAAVSDPDALAAILAVSLGVLTRVGKTRHLLIHGRTRIHVDRVEDIGTFVELETVMTDQSLQAAWDEHHELRSRLGLDEYESIKFSYSDLAMMRIDQQSKREQHK